MSLKYEPSSERRGRMVQRVVGHWGGVHCGLAPWEYEFPFPGSLTSTFLRWSSGLRATGRGCIACLSSPLHLSFLSAALHLSLGAWHGQVVTRVVGHWGGVHCVAFCPAGVALATGSEDRTIRVLKRHFPRTLLTNLPGQWLQCQANGSNLYRVLRRVRPTSYPQVASSMPRGARTAPSGCVRISHTLLIKILSQVHSPTTHFYYSSI